jgi:hypothetical protein
MRVYDIYDVWKGIMIGVLLGTLFWVIFMALNGWI